MGKYTEEELAGLSETERKLLTEDEPTDEELEALEGVAGDDEGEDGEDDEDDEDGSDDEGNAGDDSVDGGNDDNAADDGAAADTGNDDGSDGGEEFNPDDVPAISFVPKLSGEILPEFQAKIDELDSKLDEGEISSAEHRKLVRKLEADSQNEEMGNQLWGAEQTAFFKANGDYAQSKNQIKWGALNQEVIRLAGDKDSAGLTGMQLLYKAKFNVDKAFGTVVSGNQNSDQKPKAKQTPAKPKAKRPDHQTLSNTPAADESEVGKDRFAHLDKLSGMALESAISKMSDADKEAYLSGV